MLNLFHKKVKFPEFKEFRKIPRLSREIIITEKIDGTNGIIYIDENNKIYAGSRNRWLWGEHQKEIHNDNHGFARWVMEHKEELKQLGKGYHYGEWMGQGIQRNYGLKERRFYLFNASRWKQDRTIPLAEKQEYCPECCKVVPVLWVGEFDTNIILQILNELKRNGSEAVPGFMNPEGIAIYHTAGNYYFKKTIEHDEKGKSE